MTAQPASPRRVRPALVALIYLALAFLALSFFVHLGDTAAIDLKVTRFVQRGSSPALDAIARTLTSAGNTGALIVLALIAALFLWRKGLAVEALLTALTPLGELLDYGLKAWIGRPRPSGPLVHVLAPTFGLSYPSGHALASTMVYGFLAFLCYTHLRGRPRLYLSAFLVTLALAISLSRIYVGAHWFSDVVGGWCSGCFFLLLWIEFLRLREPSPFRGEGRARAPNPPKGRA